MTSQQIFVIEDNPMNFKLVRVVLSNAGYEVIGAADAEAALAQLQSMCPDVILMDIQLPGMDGLALTRLLKAAPRTQHIPILALTAYAMKGDEERVRAAGCDGYLTKPIDKRVLLTQIAQILAAPVQSSE